MSANSNMEEANQNSVNENQTPSTPPSELERQSVEPLEQQNPWHEIASNQPPYGKRILVFSPDYPKGDSMRIRVVTWLSAMSYATHWRELDEPGSPSPDRWAENKVLRKAAEAALEDFEILIVRGDLTGEPRAYQTRDKLRKALGRK